LNYKTIITLAFAFTSGVNANGLTVQPSISTSLVDSQTTSETIENRSAETLSIEPTIVVNYLSKRFKWQMSANHKQLLQRFNDESNNNNFTDYRVSGELVMIENLLNMQFRSQQSYRNTQTANSLVNDEYLGSDELSKTINNSVTLQVSLPRPDYVRLNFIGTVANVKSDKTAGSQDELNNTNANIQANVYQGDNFKRVNWSVLSSYSDTNGSADNDLKSQIIDANLGIGLISHWQLKFNAKDETNERSSSRSDINFGNLDYGSHGVGIAWYESPARFIQINYNQASRSDDDNEKFVSADLNWRVTSRTAVQASYGRRFFGESKAFSLSHNTKHLRTRLNYDEKLTTFSRLIVNTLDAGVFVCPPGETSLSDCYQPTSPTYELQQGEQYLNLSINVPEISEEVILRKSFSANIGFERRKMTTSLDIKHIETYYFDRGIDQTNNNIGLVNSYKIGPKTTLNLSLNYLISDRKLEDTQEETKDKTKSATLSATRQLGEGLSTSASFRYLDRQSALSRRDVTDRRLILSLRYTF
jgi:uncharacterized protein (PEP-CTERM system associated)